jgi:hypothetical protein
MGLVHLLGQKKHEALFSFQEDSQQSLVGIS